MKKLMKKNFIAWKGKEFTIEWYFNSRGKSTAFDYFEKLIPARRKKVLYLFMLLAEEGKIVTEEKFRYEGNQIYTFKPSPDRFLCFFFEGSKVIITNAYEKKTAKMPATEKEKALRAKEDYLERCEEEMYYD